MVKLFLSFLLPVSLMACKCLVSYPVCNEVATSNLVFIGTVESIEPAFLDPWNPERMTLLPTAEIIAPADTGRYPGRPGPLQGDLFAALSPHAELLQDPVGGG